MEPGDDSLDRLAAMFFLCSLSPMRLIPTWVRSLGVILDDGGVTIIARCAQCEQQRPVDVARLAEKVGRDYSLLNRRSPCACGGWWRFWWSRGTWDWPLWDDATDRRWLGLPPPEPTVLDLGMVAAIRERRRREGP